MITVFFQALLPKQFRINASSHGSSSGFDLKRLNDLDAATEKDDESDRDASVQNRDIKERDKSIEISLHSSSKHLKCRRKRLDIHFQ